MSENSNIEKYALNLAKTVDILRKELKEIVDSANNLFNESISIRQGIKQGNMSESAMINYVLCVLHFTNYIINRNKITDISYLETAIKYIDSIKDD